MVAPPTLDPKLAFWIRVLTTSRGAATVMEATAPAMEATKSIQVFPFFSFIQHEIALRLTLSPGGRRVVGKLEQELFGHGRPTEQLPYLVSLYPLTRERERETLLTAKEPGAFLAIVHPHPRYKDPIPSSVTSLSRPRPRIESGLVCILILRTSSGRRTCCACWMFVYAVKKREKLTTSPIPVRLLANPYQYAFQRARQTQSNEKQQQDKTQNSRSRSSVHHHTTPLVPESRLEPSTAILVNQIPEPRLTAKLVHPLGDFVSGGVSQSGEQGQEL
ncbi:hypothetical protein C347_01735 [Cryptococcus neoformans AD2-60a]|nr:hypothetical protein C347_01735 [Cryptococcus neoformans var. grubii AD2-60a]